MWLDSGSQRVPGASGRWRLVSPTSTGHWQCQLEKAIGGYRSPAARITRAKMSRNAASATLLVLLTSTLGI